MNKKILITILIILFIVMGSVIFKKALDLKERIEAPIAKRGYCYIEKNDSIIPAIYVFEKRDIDKLIKYYDSEVFNKYDYYFEDISFMKKIPSDKLIGVKAYLRDSTIISFSYQIDNNNKGETRLMYGYIPVHTFHPID